MQGQNVNWNTLFFFGLESEDDDRNLEIKGIFIRLEDGGDGSDSGTCKSIASSSWPALADSAFSAFIAASSSSFSGISFLSFGSCFSGNSFVSFGSCFSGVPFISVGSGFSGISFVSFGSGLTASWSSSTDCTVSTV